MTAITNEVLTVEELAAWLRVPVKTLYQWRTKKYGPQGKKIGRYVRYRKQDVDTWLNAVPEHAS